MIDVDDVTTSLNQGGGGKRAGTPGAGKKRVALAAWLAISCCFSSNHDALLFLSLSLFSIFSVVHFSSGHEHLLHGRAGLTLGWHLHFDCRVRFV